MDSVDEKADEQLDDHQFEKYVASEFAWWLAVVASRRSSPIDVVRLRAQISQGYERGLARDVRVRNAMKLAKASSIVLPADGVPWLWYCRSCCEPMLVFHWPGREDGAVIPIELRGRLYREVEGHRVESCPHCDAKQNIRWRSHRAPSTSS